MEIGSCSGLNDSVLPEFTWKPNPHGGTDGDKDLRESDKVIGPCPRDLTSAL